MKRHTTALLLGFTLASPLAVHAVDFTTEIRPLLEERCVSCHHPEKSKGGLLLTTREGALKGGDSGASLLPKNPKESPLLQRTLLPADHDDIMPPKGDPLSKEATEKLRQWITEDAPWPDTHILRPVSPEEAEARKILAKKASLITALTVFPGTIALETKRDFHRYVATAFYSDGTTADVTDLTQQKLADPAITALREHTLYPLKDGETKLTLSYAGQTCDIPIQVKGATENRPISFNLDVMPVFMREGCNTGGCHGASRGQDLFRLSLFGFDPESDYHSLTREMAGRRINLAEPADSLLLLKAEEKVPHTGGKLFTENSASHNTLVEWIANGARKDPEQVATIESVEIFPTQIVMEGLGSTQQLSVRARYSDGTDRDVTPLAVFISNNEPAAPVSEAGLLTATARGEAFIMARFETFTLGTQALVIPAGLEYQRPKTPEFNEIDRLVNEKLHKLRITPSGIADDHTFVRRVFADITGALPTPDEFHAFMNDGRKDKRAVLIDDLLARDSFTDMWVMKWAELLQIHTSTNDRRYAKSVHLYHQWLKEKIGQNVPINEIVIELLSSSGSTFQQPATNYWEMERDPHLVTENVAQVFMGMRIQCAQCHNHPFDRWTMDDYYSFAAFFSQIGRKRSEDPRENIVYNRNSGELNHPVTNKANPPKFLGSEAPEIPGDADRRKVVAEWLASPDNPYFARNIANIIWHHFTGVGIIEPVDDVRITNPPSNPELLDELAKRFTETQYDFRKLVRDICNSATYQRATQVNDTNRNDTRNYASATIRRLRAEVVLDAISQVTENPNKFKGLPMGARAIQIADGSTANYFLTTFGRATRGTVCSCEVQVDPNLGQALHLLNGETANNSITKGGLLDRMLEQDKTDAEIIKALYIRCFSRDPSPQELLHIEQAINQAPDERKAVLEDTFWALLNSKEFIFNH